MKIFRIVFCLMLGFTAFSIKADPSESPRGEKARGFAIDLSPLIGDNGDIQAIAPEGRALAGTMRRSDNESLIKAFSWSRRSGLRMLGASGDGSWGTASHISDDGAVVLGSLHSQSVPGRGTIWRENAPAVSVEKKFSLPNNHWLGLSANGQRAAGISNGPGGYAIDGAEQFVLLPGTLSLNPDSTPGAVAPRRNGSLPDDSLVGEGNFLFAMSRDGLVFALQNGRGSLVTNIDRDTVRELTVYGHSPSRPDGKKITSGEKKQRSDDKQSLPLLRKNAPGNPLGLERDVALREVIASQLSYDGTYVLGTVVVAYPLPAKGQATDTALRLFMEGGSVDVKEERYVVRWDAKGNIVRMGPADGRPLAISDDGGTVLLESDDNFPYVWREGKGLVRFQDYLAGYGVALPGSGYRERIWTMTMSPDGRCFSGAWPSDISPRRSFLACVGNGADGKPLKPPSWKLPSDFR